MDEEGITLAPTPAGWIDLSILSAAQCSWCRRCPGWPVGPARWEQEGPHLHGGLNWAGLGWAGHQPPPPGRTHSLPHAVCQGHGDRCLYSRLSHLTGIFSLASRASPRHQPKQLSPTEEVLVLGWTAARFCAAGRTSGSLGDSLEYTKSASLCSFDIYRLVLIKVQSSGQMHRFGSAMAQI